MRGRGHCLLSPCFWRVWLVFYIGGKLLYIWSYRSYSYIDACIFFLSGEMNQFGPSVKRLGLMLASLSRMFLQIFKFWLGESQSEIWLNMNWETCVHPFVSIYAMEFCTIKSISTLLLEVMNDGIFSLADILTISVLMLLSSLFPA